MTRDEVIQHLCETVGIVYHSIGDYSQPSDGICSNCAAQKHTGWNFLHDGGTLRYVRNAVVEKLVKDGFDPSKLL